MENQQARDELIAELKRHGLPPAYIQRLLEELDDHLADMEEERSRKMNGARKPESTNTEVQNTNVISLHQRLGDPAQLAALAAKQYHNRSFLGRHPVLTFLVMPLPMIVLGIALIILTMIPISMLMDQFWPGFLGFELDRPVLLGTLSSVVLWMLLVFPPLFTALFCCRIARRNALNWRWSLIACGLICCYCACLNVFYNNPSMIKNDAKGFMCVGIGFSLSARGVAFHFLPKLLLPMTICFLLIKRAQRLQKIEESRQEIDSSLRRAA